MADEKRYDVIAVRRNTGIGRAIKVEVAWWHPAAESGSGDPESLRAAADLAAEAEQLAGYIEKMVNLDISDAGMQRLLGMSGDVEFELTGSGLERLLDVVGGKVPIPVGDELEPDPNPPLGTAGGDDGTSLADEPAPEERIGGDPREGDDPGPRLRAAREAMERAFCELYAARDGHIEPIDLGGELLTWLQGLAEKERETEMGGTGRSLYKVLGDAIEALGIEPPDAEIEATEVPPEDEERMVRLIGDEVAHIRMAMPCAYDAV